MTNYITEDQLKNYLAKWILKIGEVRLLSRSTVTGIVEDVSGLFTFLMRDFHQRMCGVLQNNDIDPFQVHGFTELFDPSSIYVRPFSGLSTSYLQMDYYKKNFNFVVY